MFKIHRHRKFANGQMADYDLYFALNMYELFELSEYYGGELTERINEMVIDEDVKGITKFVKQILLLSYGEFHDDDCSMFYKFDINAVPLAEKFMQSDDFGDIMMKLLTDEDVMNAFMKDIIDYDIMTDSIDRDKVSEHVSDVIRYIQHCSDNITRLLNDINGE